MSESDDEKIAALEAVLWHDDPRFARALGKGRPRPPREYRRRRARPALAVALGAVVTGAVLPHGVMMATGLVMTAMVISLFGPGAGRRTPPPGS
ncbi:DUF3040 domain-containing protein [Streptomyces sp. NPDC058867]|uniref:DUF3040 domain-containing protein n=1 Tax=unclassified Streptomyces TaxID=2593676 RepID=UPI0036996B36